MRRVVIRTLCRVHTPSEVYARISDFARYPELTETVREVVLHPSDGDGSVVSEWTVHFRNGLLRWTERDMLDPQTLSITFSQVRGDFETFTGSWAIEDSADGTRITFDACFDLGIPTLADILDPVAEATLRNNILVILRGLLGDVATVDSTALGGSGASDAAEAEQSLVETP